MAKCSKCGMIIPDDADVCPYCKEKTTHYFVFGAIALAFFGFIGYQILSDAWPIFLLVGVWAIIGLVIGTLAKKVPTIVYIIIAAAYMGSLFLGLNLLKECSTKFSDKLDSYYIGVWDGYNTDNQHVYQLVINDDLSNSHEWIAPDGSYHSANFRRAFEKDGTIYFTDSENDNPQESKTHFGLNNGEMIGNGIIIVKRKEQ